MQHVTRKKRSFARGSDAGEGPQLVMNNQGQCWLMFCRALPAKAICSTSMKPLSVSYTLLVEMWKNVLFVYSFEIFAPTLMAMIPKFGSEV
jgi:hypothetical protein